MAEAAIALSYPEPENQGRFLGFWLSFRIFGQILGGAVNVGLNADRDTTGQVTYSVFQVFIALQAAAPITGLLLSSPKDVQRTDGIAVSCGIPKSRRVLDEIKATGRLFLGSRFLLIVPLIAQAVFAEAVCFSYVGWWFTVRSRALGSLLSGVVALIAGNLLGQWLDSKRLSLRLRARGAFAVIMSTQGAWWLWGMFLVKQHIASRYLCAVADVSTRDYQRHQILQRTTSVRLIQQRFWERLCLVLIHGHRLSDQLHVPVLCDR